MISSYKLHRFGSNRIKCGFYLIQAVIIFVLLVFQDQLTNLLISLIADDVAAKSDLLAADLYSRYHNAIFYGTVGIGFFFLLNSIEYFFFKSNQDSSQLIRYGCLLNRMVQCLVVFVFFDIVLQNIDSKITTFSNFAMRYQALGGLVGIEIIIVWNFYVTNRKR